MPQQAIRLAHALLLQQVQKLPLMQGVLYLAKPWLIGIRLHLIVLRTLQSCFNGRTGVC